MVHQLISLDGDRNEMPVCLVGMYPCVVPKKNPVQYVELEKELFATWNQVP